jgi:hypothetical protein
MAYRRRKAESSRKPANVKASNNENTLKEIFIRKASYRRRQLMKMKASKKKWPSISKRPAINIAMAKEMKAKTVKENHLMRRNIGG